MEPNTNQSQPSSALPKSFYKEFNPTEEDILSEGWVRHNPSVEESLGLAHSLKRYLRILLGGSVTEIKAILCEATEADGDTPERLKQEIQSVMSMTDMDILRGYTVKIKNCFSLGGLEKIADDHFVYQSEKVVYFKKDSHVRIIITNLAKSDDKTWVRFASNTRLGSMVLSWSVSGDTCRMEPFDLPAWDTIESLQDLHERFHFLSKDYQENGLGKKQSSLPARVVLVHKMKPGDKGNFKDLYDFLGAPLDQMTMTENGIAQILFSDSKQCKNIREYLHLEQVNTSAFFLVKEGEVFLVIGISNIESRGLRLDVYRQDGSDWDYTAGSGDTWSGEDGHCFVIPVVTQ